jgi:hypothetical protein
MFEFGLGLQVLPRKGKIDSHSVLVDLWEILPFSQCLGGLAAVAPFFVFNVVFSIRCLETSFHFPLHFLLSAALNHRKRLDDRIPKEGKLI